MKHAQDVVDAIDAGYERPRHEGLRDYIGASIIGNACDAYLAFSLRGFPNDEPSPRLQRIFELGHKIEAMVVRDLKERADVRVWETDGLTGKQHSFEELGGHVVAHADGLVALNDQTEEVLILEIKSMNDKSWTSFRNKGVAVSHPQYFAQLQMMMGLSGIERSLFIAYNKNTSEYHAEIVEADEFEWSAQQVRIGRVLDNDAARVTKNPDDWRCRGCFKRTACWNPTASPVPIACRTCTHAVAAASGGWWCDLHDRPADAPCADWTRYEPKEKP